jgi:hypothetical protein
MRGSAAHDAAMTDEIVDPIVEAVRADLRRRSEVGIQKYGTTLAGNPIDLRAWLEHLLEELLDASCYVKRAIVEMDRTKDGLGTD